MIRAVTRAVKQRLGDAGPDVVELVVREVATAMASPAGAAPADDGTPMVDNRDGTVTTGLGSVLPRPQNGPPLGTCASCVEQVRRKQSGPRAVLTATGLNRRGVIATLGREIAELDGDIQDVSQTIVADYFTLIFVIDVGGLSVSFADLKQRIQTAAEKLGIRAVIMHEDVMRALQRV